MSGHGSPAGRIAGLGFAVVLGLACWALYARADRLVGGTAFGDLGLLVAFMGIVAILTFGNWLWTGFGPKAD